jgi:hypothetical protein
MKIKEIHELKIKEDGSYEFRLLSPSAPKIEIERVKITLKDIVFAFITSDDGIMSESPEAKIIFEDGKEVLSRDILAAKTIELGNWQLKLLYAFSGEFPDRSVQTSVHFLLKRK